MTDSVYFDPALGGNGKTITNDSDPTTGLDNDGHRRNDGSGFVGALGQVVVMAQTAVTGASNAAASASTASTAAATATTKAGEASSSANAAAASALSASDDADAVAAALASIAGGPVVSINGKTGVATLNSSEIPFTPTGNIAATNVQAAIAELDAEKATATNGTLVSPTINDGYVEETATTSGTGITYSFTNGTIQRLQTTGNATITLPAVATGKSFQLQVEFGGAHTLSFAGGSVAWSDNTTPTFSGASGKTDVINFVANYAGTKWLGALHGKGYV